MWECSLIGRIITVLIRLNEGSNPSASAIAYLRLDYSKSLD